MLRSSSLGNALAKFGFVSVIYTVSVFDRAKGDDFRICLDIVVTCKLKKNPKNYTQRGFECHLACLTATTCSQVRQGERAASAPSPEGRVRPYTSVDRSLISCILCLLLPCINMISRSQRSHKIRTNSKQKYNWALSPGSPASTMCYVVWHVLCWCNELCSLGLSLQDSNVPFRGMPTDIWVA